MVFIWKTRTTFKIKENIMGNMLLKLRMLFSVGELRSFEICMLTAALLSR